MFDLLLPKSLMSRTANDCHGRLLNREDAVLGTTSELYAYPHSAKAAIGMNQSVDAS
jgi:hypothetical protein